VERLVAEWGWYSRDATPIHKSQSYTPFCEEPLEKRAMIHRVRWSMLDYSQRQDYLKRVMGITPGLGRGATSSCSYTMPQEST